VQSMRGLRVMNVVVMLILLWRVDTELPWRRIAPGPAETLLNSAARPRLLIQAWRRAADSLVGSSHHDFLRHFPPGERQNKRELD